MKVIVFDTHGYDRAALDKANAMHGHELCFLNMRLDPTTVHRAEGHDAVIGFVNDQFDDETLTKLAVGGVRLIALRCAGHNNVDMDAARRLGLSVVNVPSYAPHPVAEYVLALVLSLVRRLPQAHDRVRGGNFSIEGLVGFNLYGKTFGIVGLGQIGMAVATIAQGMGCQLLAYDPAPPPTDLPITFVELEQLLAASQIVSLHAPLTPETRHMLDRRRLGLMQPGSVLINTSRGGLIDTDALIDTVKEGRFCGVGLDVYEKEEAMFYRDLSNEILTDDDMARLMTFKNVIVTSHMGFLTQEALQEIANTTLASLSAYAAGLPLAHAIAA
ncbi:MAG TPA: 2-hydroxyacid dehydrogenase [Acidocella sp.]|uniref:2-hydroxyacid dehydrogenase n=1 Tax=Acidocella sp. TaxID=50710 RepID=UPI002B7AAA3A|nr:2-hydroxyacid dehydrogenase [Acidocella sp.]HVE23541.1 2-hydroxyacid dehydrogenase [Acidocella sp.]